MTPFSPQQEGEDLLLHGLRVSVGLLTVPAFFSGLLPAETQLRLTPEDLCIGALRISKENVVRVVQSETDIHVVETVGSWRRRRRIRLHHPARDVALLCRTLQTWAHNTSELGPKNRFAAGHHLEPLDPKVTPDGLVIDLPPNPTSNLGIGLGLAILFAILSVGFGFGVESLLLWAGLLAPLLLIAMNHRFNRSSLRIGPDALELEGA